MVGEFSNTIQLELGKGDVLPLTQLPQSTQETNTQKSHEQPNFADILRISCLKTAF